jgi:tRNA dimethylallyltransferase
MKKVLVIAGPTASGKTGFSLTCARRFQGEIVSGDSIQVYRGLDIGSGKIRPQEMQGVKHHLIDVLDPGEPCSVAAFQAMARSALDECAGLPILVGGTGLYLKACLYDYVFSKENETEPADPQLEALGSEELYGMLKEQDPKQAEKIHPNNRRRILRSLSILRRTGVRQSEAIGAQQHALIYDAFIAGCTMERSELYERIDARVEQMVRDGLEQEVRGLIAAGVKFSDPCMRGIGYREWQPYLGGQADLAATVALIQKHSHQFAKRQYTWLNHQMPVHWFDSTKEAEQERILTEIQAWMNA